MFVQLFALSVRAMCPSVWYEDSFFVVIISSLENEIVNGNLII